MADTERAKTYRAEQAVRSLLEVPGSRTVLNGIPVIVPDERKFGRVEDIQTYVDKVLNHLGVDRPVTVRVRAGQTKAHYERMRSVIAIPEVDRWAMRETVVLHELSHHLTEAWYEPHGPEFRRNFCDLMEKVLAPEARFMLQMCFWDEGLTC